MKINEIDDDYPVSVVFTYQQLRMIRVALSTFNEHNFVKEAEYQIDELIEKLDKIAVNVKIWESI